MKEKLRISGIMQRELSGDYIFILLKATSKCHFLPNMSHRHYPLYDSTWIISLSSLRLLDLPCWHVEFIQEKVTLCYIIQWPLLIGACKQWCILNCIPTGTYSITAHWWWSLLQSIVTLFWKQGLNVIFS